MLTTEFIGFTIGQVVLAVVDMMRARVVALGWAIVPAIFIGRGKDPAHDVVKRRYRIKIVAKVVNLGLGIWCSACWWDLEASTRGAEGLL